MKTRSLPFALALSCAAAGCALTSRSEPMRVRYYTLDTAPGKPPPGPSHSPVELRLGRIEASDYLNEQIAIRNGRHELEFYDDLRWSEKPAQYLRRALTRALFQERGVTRAYSGMAPTLDVELTEFEELRDAQPKVRLSALVTLHDERRSQLEETITVERPLQGASASTSGGAEATAAALSAAMGEAVAGLAERVIAQLNTNPPNPTTAASPAWPGETPAVQAGAAAASARP